jgi:hypothetical protein
MYAALRTRELVDRGAYATVCRISVNKGKLLIRGDIRGVGPGSGAL